MRSEMLLHLRCILTARLPFVYADLRMYGIQEVSGSIPLFSTKKFRLTTENDGKPELFFIG
jgi:hypothetical protein